MQTVGDFRGEVCALASALSRDFMGHFALTSRMEEPLRRVILCVTSWMVLWAALPAWAFERDSNTAPPAITEEERILQEAQAEKKPFPLGASVSLSQSLGGGTFTEDPYVRRASYDVSLSLSPYWRITPLLRLSAGLSVSQSLVENYDSSVVSKNRILLSDTSLALNHMRLFVIPGVGISVRGGISITLPTSLQSQYRSLYFSSKAGLSMSKSIGPVYFAYGLSFFKNFNRYTSPVLDKSKVGEHVVLAHYGGNEQLTTDLVAVGGNNTNFGIGNQFVVSWNISDELSLAAMYGINHAWTYNTYEDDELTGLYADAGRGMRDSQMGVVDISYMVNPHLYLSLGSQTMVAPKTADNKGVIFPFLNFSNNYRNNSSVYLSVGGQF
jgi:hypothetical protein